MGKNRRRSLLFVLLMAVLTASCESGQGKPGGETPKEPSQLAEAAKEPVELTVYYIHDDKNTSATFMDPNYLYGFGGKIQRKYPNFSIRFISEKDMAFDQLSVTKTPVDIFWGDNYRQIVDGGYASYDFSDLVKKYDFDLTRIEPVSLNSFRKLAKGTLNALPVFLNTQLLAYNRDIFDKFGEPYPQKGMTWDQLYQVARKLTREDGGVQYVGFGDRGALQTLNPYGTEYIDPATGKGNLNHPQWTAFYRNFIPFYQIPGNDLKPSDASGVVEMFITKKRQAMANLLTSQVTGQTIVNGNYDVVQLPSFPDKPGVGAQPSPFYFSVSSTSQHKEQAFLAISYLLSDEVQSELARQGAIPVVRIPDLENIIAVENPALKGRNRKALIPDHYAPLPNSVPNGVTPGQLLGEAFQAAAKGEKE